MSIQRAEADLAKARLEAQHFAARSKEALERVRELEIFLEVARRYDLVDAAANAQNGDRINGDARSQHGGQTIIDAVIEVLQDAGSRQTTRELLVHLERKGRPVGGMNKAANLASILSKSGLVNSDKVNGWGLNTWGATPPASLIDVPEEQLPF